jgi:hypothetical protein
MMNSNRTRRDFIATAGAWTFGLAITQPFKSLAGALASLPDEQILRLLGDYATQIQVVGGSVIGLLGGQLPSLTKILIDVAPDKLSKLQTISQTPIYVSGNSIEFQLQGKLIEVDQRPTPLVSGAATSTTAFTYRHSALIYDLIQRRLIDPYGALHLNQLELVNWPKDLESLFSASLSGLVDSQIYRLKQSPSFLQLQTNGLNQSVQSGKTAETILIDYLGNLPLLARFGGNVVAQTVGASQTVVSSLAVLGITYSALRQKQLQIIAGDSSSVQDGAAWLAVCTQAKQLQPIAGQFMGRASQSAWGRQTISHAGRLTTQFAKLFDL